MEKADSLINWQDFKPGYPVAFDPYKDSEGFRLDHEAGQQAIDFFPECLRHIKGSLALEPIELELWQQAIIGHLFGWKSKKTGLRRFREAFILIPRKNGKTLLAAGLALYFLFSENERGSEIYCAASDRNQARLLFDVAKNMAVKDPEMAKRARILRNEIQYPAKDSTFQVISSESASKHGFNSSLVVLDELHVIQDPELVHVLQTSTGARKEPLIISLTTAGYDQQSICFEKYQYSKGVIDGSVSDSAYFPVIYEIPDGADWTEPKVWQRVNPNINVSLEIDYLHRECERAKTSPVYEAVFRRLHLNQWTESESPFISLDDWDGCEGVFPELAGRTCYGGLDLSSTQDLTAFSLCFPPEKEDHPYYFLSFAWVPERAVREQRKRFYYDWVKRGYLNQVPGDCIEYSFIIGKILECKSRYDLRGVLFDRWGIENVRQQLENEGVAMVGFGQGYKSMSGPTKELLRLVLSRKVKHDGDPVLRWCIGNLTVEIDPAGSIKPSKRKSSEKIDLAVSSIMALAGCLSNPVEPEYESVYEKRPWVYAF